MSKSEIKHVASFSFNNTMHGGLTVVCTWTDNGDNLPNGASLYMTQSIILSANCNQAEIQLYEGLLTPEKLRDLAYFIEFEERRAKSKELERTFNQMTCPRCGGHGFSEIDPGFPCEGCGGKR